jgi:hypothetical protein
MTSSTRSARDHLAAVSAWDGADVARMPADDALAAVEAGAAAIHALQAVVARFAARVDVVCEQSPGASGYARRHGAASGPSLLAKVAGLAPGEANRLVTMGRALLAADAAAERAQREAELAAREAREAELAEANAAPGLSAQELSWDDLPPESNTPEPNSPAPTPPARAVPVARELAPGELLARALDAGTISPQKGEVISATLADFTIDTLEVEKEFVELAPRVGLRKLMAHCFWRLGELDPEGLALREARHREERFVSITDRADGRVQIYGLLDVATAAPVKTLLDSMTTAAMRRQRKLPQQERLEAGALCADALTDVALHAIGCDRVPRKPKTTVVVRIDKDALIDDLRLVGLADEAGVPLDARTRLTSVDGILQPLTASAARLMAVDAQVLPMVMGGGSLPLDLGATKRLFTKWQKIAVTERDRGCVRCTAPPAFCHGHHIQFWDDSGPTNLTNAVSLCSGCHHRLHEQHWDLRVYNDRVEIREPGSSWEPAFSPPRQATRPERRALTATA